MLLRVVFNDLFILMSIVFHIPQQWVGAALTLMFACSPPEVLKAGYTLDLC